MEQLLAELSSAKAKFEDARGSFIAHKSGKAVAKEREIRLSIEDVEEIWTKMVDCLALYDSSVKQHIADNTQGSKALLTPS